MPVSIAIIGPGAIGGTVGAWLSRNDMLNVAVCARTPFDGLVVETPDETIRATPRLLLDPAKATPADWVLIATKTYDVEGTAAWLGALAGPATHVAVLQNGVGHVDRFAPYVAPERILPVVVDIPAERVAPGHIRQRRTGTMLVPEGAAGATFASFFDGTAIAVSQTPDFTTAAWRKLCVNCAGAVSVLTLEGAGVARREQAAALMQQLIAECIAVGRAEGADLPDDIVQSVIDGYRASPADSLNSMHADRLAGRPMEWDARNGVISRLGRRHGIATPVSDVVSALLAAIDDAARNPG